MYSGLKFRFNFVRHIEICASCQTSDRLTCFFNSNCLLETKKRNLSQTLSIPELTDCKSRPATTVVGYGQKWELSIPNWRGCQLSRDCWIRLPPKQALLSSPSLCSVLCTDVKFTLYSNSISSKRDKIECVCWETLDRRAVHWGSDYKNPNSESWLLDRNAWIGSHCKSRFRLNYRANRK